MWLTNGGSSTLTAVLVRTDEEAPEGSSVYKKMSTFLIESPPGSARYSPDSRFRARSKKMGYKEWTPPSW